MLPIFHERLTEHQISQCRERLDTLQINNGRLCNLACLHCHVEAGPKRTELMDERTTRRILELLADAPSIETVDITGGAPEMNPWFKLTVEESRQLGKSVIDRCNLTIFYEDDYGDLPEFLADHQVHIVASLPCYTSDNVDKQRGRGTFNGSIEALLWLNRLGYGKENSSLRLDLVYNPLGASLPPAQKKLEEDYKNKLFDDFGIEFHQLYTITNMPIKRFHHHLARNDELDSYMTLLSDHFNPEAAKQIMCKNLISVGWTGELYDCDFNQMLELPAGGKRKSIWDIERFEDVRSDEIIFESHCYGCTAGAGSSCSGSLL